MVRQELALFLPIGHKYLYFMNLSAGYPYNLIRHGLPFDYPQLQKDHRADIVIMGGGVSGALVAHYLAKLGIQCLVVDARTIGLGSTCASTSLLQYEIDERLTDLSVKIGRRKAERAYHLCANAILQLASIAEEIGYPDFRLNNSIYFAATEKDVSALHREFVARKESGFSVHWLEQKELEKRYLLQAPAAIVSELGAQTNAYTLTHALHQYNVGNVDVYDRTLITRIEHRKKDVLLTTNSGCSIRCKQLVYATGYEAVRYIDEKIVNLSATYATVSEQLGEKDIATNPGIYWNTASPYLYMRMTDDNRILIGGRDQPIMQEKKMNALIGRKSGLLVKDFARYFPGVPFKKEFSWTGIFGSTKDGLPFIGNYPKLPNSLFALGFGGNGITFSVIAAQLLADSVAGRRNNDLSLFSFDRV